MGHPIFVGIASLVPGLGYILLGEVRKAFYVWLGMLTCALVYLFSPFEFLWDVAAIAFLGIWFVQLVWASREAGLMRRIASGQAAPARESLAAAPPSGLSRKERYAFELREMIKAQVGLGETVGPVVSVMDRSRASIYTGSYTLGVLDSGLVIVEMSMSIKPKSVDRIGRERINRVEFKKGMLTDRLRIRLSDRKRPVQFFAQRAFREHMQVVASALEGLQNKPQ
jgi:hypothetical protein